jgi:predicted nucleic acid-binding protein
VKAIADTGFIVAFANRNDAHHDWALELAECLTEPLLTCEAVLAEAAFHLRDSHLVLPVLTTDVRDFRVYRRGRREAIPLIFPQAKR